MDYTQRLKWIEKVFNEEPSEALQPHSCDRISENICQPDTIVKLPVKHVGVFRPEHYEPGYAYPLVIWLHPDGGSEHDLHEIMPQISMRNYLGLSFRAPAIDPDAPSNGYHWPDSHLFAKQFSQSVQTTVQELKKVLNIHDDRIFLAGSGTGCSIATKLLLQTPHYFAGAALIKGRFSQSDFQSVSHMGLKDKRILLDHSIINSGENQMSSQWLSHKWETTGAETYAVDSLQFESENQPEMLSTLNRWVMESIATARFV